MHLQCILNQKHNVYQHRCQYPQPVGVFQKLEDNEEARIRISHGMSDVTGSYVKRGHIETSSARST